MIPEKSELLISNTLEVTYSQKIVSNISCITVEEDMDGSGKTDLLVGTSYGLMCMYRLTPKDSADQPMWLPLKSWNMIQPIKALVFFRVETRGLLSISLGDGNVYVIQFPNKDNPERASKENFVYEKCVDTNTYTLIAQHMNNFAAVNGNGKFCLFYDLHYGLKALDAQRKLELELPKRPIFIGFLNIDDIVVVGCSDGCVYFIGNSVLNCFRFEEPPQTYAINKHNSALCVMGLNSNLCLYENIHFMNNTIPHFVESIEDHLEDIRRMTGDFETPADQLIKAYLYMPLN